jgi:hypothetical protein
MIDPEEYYLACAGEECLEVATRIQKAIRFGILEQQPGQDLNNWQRIAEEWDDLQTAMEVLIEKLSLQYTRTGQTEKRQKIEKYLKHAQSVSQVSV